MLRLDSIWLVLESGERILKNIHLQVEAGQLVVLLGNNGAGKSDLLSLISGIQKPTKGTVMYDGKNISNLAPSRIVRKGICHVPEGRRLFLDQTVEDNLILGAYTRLFRQPKRVINREVGEILEQFSLLKEHGRQLAGTLSAGELQILAIARALMAKPKILMLDEPSLGLAPLAIKEVFDIIIQLRKEGMGILLAEQLATYAIRNCDYGYVLQRGRIALEGKRHVLEEKSGLVKTYLA
jgi:ABC-type branched-subunit amino acid transport system ATPase component